MNNPVLCLPLRRPPPSRRRVTARPSPLAPPWLRPPNSGRRQWNTSSNRLQGSWSSLSRLTPPTRRCRRCPPSARQSLRPQSVSPKRHQRSRRPQAGMIMELRRPGLELPQVTSPLVHQNLHGLPAGPLMGLRKARLRPLCRIPRAKAMPLHRTGHLPMPPLPSMRKRRPLRRRRLRMQPEDRNREMPWVGSRPSQR